MMIDPNFMDEQLPPKENTRYQKRAAMPQPMMEMYEDEEEMNTSPSPQQPRPEQRQYENPRHELEDEILPGLYRSDITSWKKQFNGEVYSAEVKDTVFIFRPLERFEYKEIIGTPNTDPLMREEMICEYCVLYPQGFDFSTMANQKAGYPAVLSEIIMDHSGFTRDVKVSKL